VGVAFIGASVFTSRWEMGIRDRPISPWSPWQNGYAERLIGNAKPRSTDHDQTIALESSESGACQDQTRSVGSMEATHGGSPS
jgi:hypothetical protein